ncbi:isoquinoline 1-oxidoreductase beta subunit [Sphingomonas sp. PP-CE-3G-477]|uniref:xanthine dehydrogenase family protein molybdopterin-binding subunit n=1 Tax=Sphingomonas sp. PP-CE-3G-477 TaxID=2135660 RepID=UPI000D382CEA|nr:molybdopterin cofactor-binding domain-containing protein [Sphingomonas sp. PP-CE-3G-477]PTQ61555.1 isoquinoline 1-oxidoreductase beta subunit [Sphingomonas sp. PP-CE-3G-477]
MINRREILIGGGAGIGLVVAWSLWPRTYAPNLVANPGETPLGAWLKIGTDGHVTVAVPQVEHGQGVYTTLPQIVADELGADWRTIGVEPAPLNPLYANPIGTHDLFEGLFDRLPAGTPQPPMLTGGSSSIRMFEQACREAGAGARALLCMAAAKRWDADWTQVNVDAGFCTYQTKRIRFAELAEEAAKFTLLDPLPLGIQGAGKLVGKSVPRLDTPSKVDGSANFASDVRLADMVHAAIRQGPVGSRLTRVDRAAADRIRGVLSVVENPRWVAAVATTGWAAQKALDALAPRFENDAPLPDIRSIDAALDAVLARPGTQMASAGDVAATFQGAKLVTATYRAGLGLHAAIETRSATASFSNGRLELWLATQAPGLARSAAARATDLSEDAVVVHPMLIGGSFGAALEHDVAEQAAVLAVKLSRPVSLVWSRGEDSLHDHYRPPAVAKMAARLAPNGAIMGWSANIAAPSTGTEMARRMMPGLATEAALIGVKGDRYAVAGAAPVYRIPAYAIEHHPAKIGIPTGHLRGGAHGYTAFFTECFLDELARTAQSEPMSFRIAMLGGEPRLARCLSTAAALGGWDGGVAGSGQGIAAHAFRGSYIAVMAEAHMGPDQRPVVDRLVAAVDCGAQINPDIVRQQIEGGLIFGMAAALGASTGFTRGLAEARGFDTIGLPRLADTPDITVEVIRSDEAPGGVGELGVPAVAPAIANALYASTGFRIRNLPLRPAP